MPRELTPETARAAISAQSETFHGLSVGDFLSMGNGTLVRVVSGNRVKLEVIRPGMVDVAVTRNRRGRDIVPFPDPAA